MVRYIVNLCPHASDEADLLKKKDFEGVGSRFIMMNERWIWTNSPFLGNKTTLRSMAFDIYKNTLK
jgi:hypothetical protein